MRKPIFLLLVAFVILNLITFVPPSFAFSLSSGSSLNGLVELKTMAKESTPYDIAMENSQPTLIEFYADWCTTCQAMAHPLHELKETNQDKINFVMVNIDDPQWSQQIENYQVNAVPQFIFLSAQGEAKKMLYGKVPQSVLAELLQKLLII